MNAEDIDVLNQPMKVLSKQQQNRMFPFHHEFDLGMEIRTLFAAVYVEVALS